MNLFEYCCSNKYDRVLGLNRRIAVIKKVFKSLLVFLGVFALMSGASFAAPKHAQLKAFPLANQGMERFVIVLPHKERGEEDDFKVELIAGKEMLTDGVNLVRLGNIIKPQPLKGWGYTYYEVAGSPHAMSTLMGVPPGTQRMKEFVTGVPLQIRYNSRLPVVVYVPKGYKVKYRIWKASETTLHAEKG